MPWSDPTERGAYTNYYVFVGIIVGTVVVGGGIATYMDRNRSSGSNGSPPPSYSDPPPSYSRSAPQSYAPAPPMRSISAPPRPYQPPPRGGFSNPGPVYSRPMPRSGAGYAPPTRFAPTTTLRHRR